MDERPIVRRMITAEYRFTEGETLELANQLAAKTQERSRLEDSKKAAASQYKSEIDGVSAEVEALSQKISTGREHREFFCRAEFDYEAGIKHWVDDKTGDLRKSEPLTANDWQTRLELEDGTGDDEGRLLELDIRPEDLERIDVPEDRQIIDDEEDRRIVDEDDDDVKDEAHEEQVSL